MELSLTESNNDTQSLLYKCIVFSNRETLFHILNIEILFQLALLYD